jgi:hypothetical protein
VADRIFKGRLITTGDIHEENVRAFPEASEDFKKPHKGGLSPYQVLYDIFKTIEEHVPAGISSDLQVAKVAELIDEGAPWGLQTPVRQIGDSLWISGGNAWIKIDPDGSFEIGTSGV